MGINLRRCPKPRHTFCTITLKRKPARWRAFNRNAGRVIALCCAAYTETAKLLGGADAADGGSAVGALTLGDGLAVLRNALDGVLHDLLRLALDAIRLDSHSYLQMLSTGHRPISTAHCAVFQREQ